MERRSAKSYDLPNDKSSFSEPAVSTAASTDELVTDDGVADRGNWSKIF